MSQGNDSLKFSLCLIPAPTSPSADTGMDAKNQDGFVGYGEEAKRGCSQKLLFFR